MTFRFITLHYSSCFFKIIISYSSFFFFFTFFIALFSTCSSSCSPNSNLFSQFPPISTPPLSSKHIYTYLAVNSSKVSSWCCPEYCLTDIREAKVGKGLATETILEMAPAWAPALALNAARIEEAIISQSIDAVIIHRVRYWIVRGACAHRLTHRCTSGIRRIHGPRGDELQLTKVAKG